MNKWWIAFIYLGAAIFTLFKWELFSYGIPSIFERMIIGFFYGMIIIEQNFSKNSFFKMGNFKIISKLGIYTYGLYCLHRIRIFIGQKIMGYFDLNLQNVWLLTLLMVLSLIISIIISLASYHFFEKWFLKLKDKFAVIHKK